MTPRRPFQAQTAAQMEADKQTPFDKDAVQKRLDYWEHKEGMTESEKTWFTEVALALTEIVRLEQEIVQWKRQLNAVLYPTEPPDRRGRAVARTVGEG